ncbi:M16 family metallopeptidase [Mucilaginibacter calamicampi]|uniref:M16 family metallopeptidase n=1 Tax=Mucilaginibacter calamicampi TaxID=1302352 RepID=A0ABW2YWV5_9SPHI
MNFKHTFFLSATVLLVTAGGAFAQVKKKPAPSPKSKPVPAAKQIAPPANAQILPSDPFLLKGTLPNGLTYYIRSTTALAKNAEVVLVNKAGSVLETDAQRGYAHLISHLALKGTPGFTEEQLAAFMQLNKGKLKADSNAISSYDESVYRLTVRTDTADALNKGLKLLAGWAGGITFDAANVNAAKTGVTEELKNSLNVMKDRLDKNALPFMLNNSRYALRNPKGEEAAIAAADAATLKSFYTDWYRPDLQAIIVVGDVDAKQVEATIKTIFSALKGPAVPKPVTLYAIAPVVGTQIKFITDKELPYVVTQVVIPQPRAVAKTPAGFMQSVQLNLFNEMLANRIDELRQQSNSPFLFAQAGYNSFIGKQDAFIAMVLANARGIDTAVKTLATEIERTRKFGFVSTELERAKQNALSQVGFEYQQRDNILPASIAAEYQRNFITGGIATGTSYKYNYYLDNIGKIDLATMNALAAKLLNQNRAILLQAPETEKALFPTEQAVRTWFTTGSAAVSAYEDNASIPLMEKLPVAGKVVSIKTDSTILVTNVTLSNGVKVILKPTQFQPGQIIMNGFALGGTSLASDADFTSADLAARVIGISGVAGFSQTQLERMLRNKSVNISPYTSDILHGFTGFTSANDFETAIQLLHLYFTQPRKDIAAWQKTIADTKGALVLRAVEEGSVLQDTANAILSGYNKRGMTTTIAQLNAASLDKAYQFYKDRYSNAANFTFTFTGSFTVEAILPFIETYLGSLPTKAGTETFKNLGMHPPAGNITRTIVKGKGDIALTQMIYSGKYDYSAVNNIDLDAVETILYLKLAQRIKDTTGNIQTGVRVNYTKHPESRYRVNIDIQSPVADLERVTGLVVDEINKFRQNGAEQKELNTFVLDDARTTQSQLRQNAYWSGALNVAAQTGDDPDKILLHVQSLQQLTIPRTKEAAIKYLNDANLIKLTLLPEKK